MNTTDHEKKHAERVRKSLGECMVLLRKDGSFPLSGPCRIAAYGSGVRNTVKGGTGSGEVNSRYFVNIEQGLKNAGFELTSSLWLDTYDGARLRARKDFIAKCRSEARAAHENIIAYAMGRVMPEPEYHIPLTGSGDAAIYVVSRISGEGSDRPVCGGEILLSESEKRDILALDARYEKFMLVLNVGGVVDISPVKDVKNILLLSQLGSDTGTALADVLLGRQEPSGRLTDTWAARDDYYVMDDFEDIDRTEYKDGIYVGYRYFDSFGKEPLYPFGYGLSFTDFEMAEAEASLAGTAVTVKTAVKNTGGYPGKEVVQVYISAPSGKLDKAYQELAGFAKTKRLAPGESQELTVTFDIRDFASYCEEDASYVLEAGDYIVRAGTDSRSTRPCTVISIDRSAAVKKVRNVLGDCGFRDLTPAAEGAAAAAAASEGCAEGISRLRLDSDAVICEETVYGREYGIPDEIADLTDEEAALINIGSFDPSKNALASVIGGAGVHVCGAAGETSSRVRGIPYLVMADGPAGLRLAKDYYEDEDGLHSVSGGEVLDSMGEFVTGPLKLAFRLISGKGGKTKPDAEIKHQYCTSIPIGTAIAQSFNTELAESYGDIVGSEMELFGVNLWLAPALNIHRSIRCGRNFEYFSEDPLISGLTASALARGVQKHSGCGVTIKHYAANNKELNRYCNDSRVSERAMREIYLKGFQICVREAAPAAVMTSYNLLNGTHTAEHRGLLEDILRCEFGFDGMVMTDWVVPMTEKKGSVNRNSKPRFVAAAGGDLFMPGSKRDLKDLLKGLKEGDVSAEQIRINAGRVYKVIQRLRKDGIE